MRRLLIAISALALLGACGRIIPPAAAAPTDSRRVATMPTFANQAASDFLTWAIGNDLFEVQTAEIAAVRAKNPEVKAFARLMAKDHAASMAELNQAIAASRENLAAPAGMSDHLQSMLNQLSNGTARDFDKTYVEQQVEAHEEALPLLTAYARNGRVPAIREAANHIVSKLQVHLDQAWSIQGDLNKAP